MAKYLKLDVPSSCSEDWNSMATEQTGRYCFSCQKSVVDFTQMTDGELLEYFKTLKGPTCGRFTESQVNREIPLPKRPLPWIKYFFQFSLPAFLLSMKSSGQVQKVEAPVEVAPVKPEGGIPDSSKEISLIMGNVSDERNFPLAAASVIIKGTNKGTLTDSLGNFSMSNVVHPVTLVISYVGFQTQEVKMSAVQQGSDIKLQLAPALMGEVVVVGLVSSKKIKRRELKEQKKQMKAMAITPSVVIYPNPVIAGNNLYVQSLSFERGRYNVEIYSLSGQLMQVSTVTYGKEDSKISLPIIQMLPGTYILRVTYESTGKHFSR